MLSELRGVLRPVEQVQAAEDALAAAVLAQDVAALAGLLADDSAMVVCKRMLRDKLEILAALRAYFAETAASIHCDCLQIEITRNGLLAFSSGSLLEGRDRFAIGAYESIWRYDVDLNWRLIFSQASFARAAVES